MEKFTIFDLLQLIYKSNTHMEMILRVFCIIPVTTASSAERSSSELKPVLKQSLRSVMGQKRLPNLAILSSEKDITDKI